MKTPVASAASAGPFAVLLSNPSRGVTLNPTSGSDVEMCQLARVRSSGGPEKK